MGWITLYVPEIEKRWSRFAAQAGASWRVDKTYVKIRGQVDLSFTDLQQGKTVDFLLCAKRDVATAKAFLRQAFHHQRWSRHKITLDGY